MVHKKSRRALGRGLTSLIPLDSDENGSNNEVVSVSVDAIKVNPFQPRIDFDEEEIRGLAESIKSQGLLQPIILRKNNNGYEIISGERRYRALKLIGEDKVAAIIKAQVSDREMLEIALVENIQREDLNEIEKAISYQKLLSECGLSHQQLSERVGKSRSVITNTLRLLKLPQQIQNYLRFGKLSMGHARALLSIDNEEEQKTLAEKIIDDQLTVRDIENTARKKAENAGKSPKSKSSVKIRERERELDPDMAFQEDKLRYHFGTDVKISNNDSYNGKIEISYYNKDDLNRILNLIFA